MPKTERPCTQVSSTSTPEPIRAASSAGLPSKAIMPYSMKCPDESSRQVIAFNSRGISLDESESPTIICQSSTFFPPFSFIINSPLHHSIPRASRVWTSRLLRGSATSLRLNTIPIILLEPFCFVRFQVLFPDFTTSLFFAHPWSSTSIYTISWYDIDKLFGFFASLWCFSVSCNCALGHPTYVPSSSVAIPLLCVNRHYASYSASVQAPC